MQDRIQARASALPSATIQSQTIQTQGNGTPSGVFVSNNGVHVYDEQVAIHQDILALVRKGEINRTVAAEAVARARVDVAARGTDAVVVQNYYAVIAAVRRLANSQSSKAEAARFVELTQKQEAGGEVARADVIKARITLLQRERDRQDAKLNLDKAQIALGVLIFPELRMDFAVEDDAKPQTSVPFRPVIEIQASLVSPEIKVAQASVIEAAYQSQVARYAWLPAFNFDFFYGLDANQLALRTPEDQRNVGYVAQFSMSIPVWNWGLTKSKIKQADIKRQQANLELTEAKRVLRGTSASAGHEAEAAQAQLASLGSTVDLAAESLRLTVLRYEAGESSALEVVDAQNTLVQARNASDDGEVRARLAFVNLQLLTGTF